MRVVLEVVSGRSRGRKATLQAGQLLRVGRTKWADVVLAYDPLMSPVHFALYADQLACYVQDLARTLASQLAVGPPGFVGQLLLGIQAVFLGDPKLAAARTVFIGDVGMGGTETPLGIAMAGARGILAPFVGYSPG